MTQNKLTKQGKKKTSRFMKVAIVTSTVLLTSSFALFIPLINSADKSNKDLTAQIEDATKQTEVIQKNNQSKVDIIISEN